MKSFRTILVLLAVLATASIVFAGPQSRTAPPSGSRPGAAVSSAWLCPMWTWFSGSAPAAANAPAARGPAMMYGGPGQYGPMGPGQYGAMGPGMMYGPAVQQDQPVAPRSGKDNQDSKTTAR